MKILRRIRGRKREDYSFFVFGLGNPGIQYGKTLHNAGYMAVDLLVEDKRGTFSQRKGNTLYCSLDFKGGEKVFVGKPETFMNLSGVSLKYFRKRFGFSEDSFAVVHDDLDINPGRVKVKKGGSFGGHRGVASIINGLGSSDFLRVKIGIGRPPREMDAADYVLCPPAPEIEDNFYSGVCHGADAIMMLLMEGVEKTMSYYNSDAPYSG